MGLYVRVVISVIRVVRVGFPFMEGLLLIKTFQGPIHAQVCCLWQTAVEIQTRHSSLLPSKPVHILMASMWYLGK